MYFLGNEKVDRVKRGKMQEYPRPLFLRIFVTTTSYLCKQCIRGATNKDMSLFRESSILGCSEPTCYESPNLIQTTKDEKKCLTKMQSSSEKKTAFLSGICFHFRRFVFGF